MAQAFRFTTPVDNSSFFSNCKVGEFLSDLEAAFFRSLIRFDTELLSNKLIITVDTDIPDSDGSGSLPAFDPAYYGCERVTVL